MKFYKLTSSKKRQRTLFATLAIEHSSGLLTFTGAVVIKNEAGNVIGATGVSGSSAENDHAAATAGAAAV